VVEARATRPCQVEHSAWLSIFPTHMPRYLVITQKRPPLFVLLPRVLCDIVRRRRLRWLRRRRRPRPAVDLLLPHRHRALERIDAVPAPHPPPPPPPRRVPVLSAPPPAPLPPPPHRPTHATQQRACDTSATDDVTSPPLVRGGCPAGGGCGGGSSRGGYGCHREQRCARGRLERLSSVRRRARHHDGGLPNGAHPRAVHDRHLGDAAVGGVVQPHARAHLVHLLPCHRLEGLIPAHPAHAITAPTSSKERGKFPANAGFRSARVCPRGGTRAAARPCR
jgi:hypothetical protein